MTYSNRWSALTVALVLAGCERSPTPVAPAPQDTPVPATSPDLMVETVGQAAPRDYVATPAGLRHRSCVHGLKNGSRVEERPDGFVITDKNGATHRIPRCKYPVHGHGRRGDNNVPAYNPNWIEFDTVRASQTGSTSFAQLTADWLVPAVPPATYASSQVYFTFPGLEDGHYIIQPVIQYGFSAAGGGNFWSMASWQCHGGSDCFHAPETVVSISAGDTIHGSVVASNCSNGTCTWTITGETSSASAVFTTTGLESYNWATGGAVEVYNLTTCNHYPLDGVFYTNISLYDQNMNLLSSPPWGGYVEPSIPPNVSPSCGFGLNFTSNTLNLFHRYSLSLPGISGPRQIQHFQSAQYFPTVSGGEPPYRYEWQYRKCTSGPNCTGWSPWEERSDYWVASWNCSESRIELALRVTDARLWTRTTWIEIYLSGGGSCT